MATRTSPRTLLEQWRNDSCSRISFLYFQLQLHTRIELIRVITRSCLVLFVFRTQVAYSGFEGPSKQGKILAFPVECLYNIVHNLRRQDLQSLLLYQPHPLQQIAFYLYFSTLSLHFGVRSLHRWHFPTDHEKESENNINDDLLQWHNKRSQEILMAIIDRVELGVFRVGDSPQILSVIHDEDSTPGFSGVNHGNTNHS